MYDTGVRYQCTILVYDAHVRNSYTISVYDVLTLATTLEATTPLFIPDVLLTHTHIGMLCIGHTCHHRSARGRL